LRWLSEARAREAYDCYLTYREGREGLTEMLDEFLEQERVQQPLHRYHFPDADARSISVPLAG
jgi:hypothetical protein